MAFDDADLHSTYHTADKADHVIPNTEPQKPKQRLAQILSPKKFKIIASFVLLLVLTVGLISGVVLVQQNQDLREQAKKMELKTKATPTPSQPKETDTFQRYIDDSQFSLSLLGPIQDPMDLTRPPRNDIEPTTTRKVMVVNFNPILESQNNQTLTQYMGWHETSEHANAIINHIYAASNQYVQYEIVEWHDIDGIPTKADGFQYTDDTYLQCLSDVSNCHHPDLANYLKIINDHNACEKRNNDQIHELWIWGGPYFGYYESNLTGPNSFWYNSNPTTGSTCNKQLPIMGYNYERTDGLLHPLGHRVESVITHLFGGINTWAYNYGPPPPEPPNNPSPFDIFSARGYDPTTAGCGNAHGGLNTPVYDPSNFWNYDYDNQYLEDSTCNDWFNYPNLTGTTESLNCQVWNCNQNDFLDWWHFHLPAYYGGTTDGKWNNWWRYILDFEATVNSSPPPPPPSEPEVPACLGVSGSLLAGYVTGTQPFGFRALSSGSNIYNVEVCFHGAFEGPGWNVGWQCLRDEDPTSPVYGDYPITESAPPPGNHNPPRSDFPLGSNGLTTFNDIKEALQSSGHDPILIDQLGILYYVNIFHPEGICFGDGRYTGPGDCEVSGSCGGIVKLAE